MDFRARIIKCDCCGSPLKITGSGKSAVGYVAECEYCGHENVLPRACVGDDVFGELEAGKRALLNGRFDEAKNAFSEVIRRDCEEPEGHFWFALAKNKVTFVRDYKYDKLLPICYAPLKTAFSQDKSFKKALELAQVGQKELYASRGRQIDYVIERFNDYRRQKIDFDCFICVKVSEISDDDGGEKSFGQGVDSRFNKSFGKYICNGRRTDDCEYVGRSDGLYNYLTGRGHRVFFSEVNCRSRAGEDYEAFILYALTVARCMVIVCSDETYLDTPWVKNEYARYYNFMQRNEKAAGSLTIVYNGEAVQSIRVNDENRPVQGVDGRSPQAFALIEDFIKKFNAEKPAEPVVYETAVAGGEVGFDFDGDFEYSGEDLDALPPKMQRLYLKAENGNKRAQYKVGRAYYKLYGETEHDYKKAAYWFYRSAQKGCAAAQCALGKCYANGYGVAADDNKAFYWYKKSSARSAEGKYETAFCYEQGLGVERNVPRAVELYKKAADRGNESASYRLARLYREGDGVPKSSQLAKKWENFEIRAGISFLISWIVLFLLSCGAGLYVELYPMFNLLAWRSVATVFWIICAVLSCAAFLAGIGWTVCYVLKMHPQKDSVTDTILPSIALTLTIIPFIIGMSYNPSHNYLNFYYGASHGIYYDLNDDGTLTAFVNDNYNKREMRIPEKFNGKAVTCYTNKRYYDYGATEKIYLPDSVTEIGVHAFYECTAEIIWGDNPQITAIGEQAFSYYYGEKFVIPDGVTVIEDIAFVNCRIKSLVIPASVTQIGGSAFGFNANKFVERVYYKGAHEEWENVKFGYYGTGTVKNVGLGDSNFYFYSETEPQDSGLYWRYVDGEPKAWVLRA